MTIALDPNNFPETEEDDNSELRSVASGREALMNAALLQNDLADLARAVSAPVSQIVVIGVPTAQWAAPLARHLQWRLDSVSAHAVVELKKDGNRGLAVDLTSRLSEGLHLVLVSHDPDTLLPPTLLAAVDASFSLGPPSVKLLRQAIENLTNQPVSGLRASDLARLDFDSLAMALRPGSTPKQCVQRLRQASKALRQSKKGKAATSLADLPLSPEIAAWSTALLADLRRVEAGQLPPSDLSYPLLEGPPGTGKTLIASALAQSAGWQLVSTSVGSWFSTSDGHLGGVSKAITAFFDEVLREPKSIGFIDELDAIPNRATLSERDREWWTPFVTQILLQIDRLRRSGKPVILMGATNYYDHLDSALIRSQRLETRVSVFPPRTTQEVEAIFNHYLEGALDLKVIAIAARWCLGRTPADIEGFVRAARSKAAAASRPVQAADLLDSIVPPDERTPTELRATAIHEAGHAVVSLALGLPVESVSIISQGRSGGYMQGARSVIFPNRAEIEALAMVMLGGRAADISLGKGAHAGAEQDLAVATNMLIRGMSEWGLYGNLARSTSVGALRRTEERVERLLQNLLERTVHIIERNEAAVLALADALLSERLLDGQAIDRVLQAHRHDTIIPEVNTGLVVAQGPVS